MFFMQRSSKIIELDDLTKGIEKIRRSGKRIVFTNGCFDILHVGHVRYLEAAKSEGDILIVGLNTDISVRAIKGAKRPVINQEQRAEVLSSISLVDYIVFFDEPDPFELIRMIRPDVLVKGADWQEDDIVGAEFVRANGGKVIRVPVVPDISTSQIIERILTTIPKY